MNNIHKDTISIKSYDKMAKYYADFVDTKPWNAYYERPAMISLLPGLKDLKVLDLGCAGGWYSKYLLDNGSDVTAIDVNKNMIEATKKRTEDKCRVIQADINNGFGFIKDSSFDMVLASLVLHYIKDIGKAFIEINRILKSNGRFIFSTHHPLMEFVYFERENYLALELLDDEWIMDNDKIKVQFYRRPLNKLLQPLIDSVFFIEKILEPEPTKEFKEKLPDSYERLLKKPNFLLIRARKIN